MQSEFWSVQHLPTSNSVVYIARRSGNQLPEKEIDVVDVQERNLQKAEKAFLIKLVAIHDKLIGYIYTLYIYIYIYID